MANDKNGALLFVGDEVVLRAKVTDILPDHVLTVNLFPPCREFYFMSAAVERTAQGPASLDADKQAAKTIAAQNAAPAPEPPPANAAPTPLAASSSTENAAATPAAAPTPDAGGTAGASEAPAPTAQATDAAADTGAKAESLGNA